jgi:hypothetical protein
MTRAFNEGAAAARCAPPTNPLTLIACGNVLLPLAVTRVARWRPPSRLVKMAMTAPPGADYCAARCGRHGAVSSRALCPARSAGEPSEAAACQGARAQVVL